MSAVAKRYAVALVSLASEEASLDAVSSDLDHLADLLETSEAFRSFVQHPLIPPEAQTRSLEALFKGKCDRLTLNLLLLLVRRERLAVLPDILDQARELIQAENGVLPVDVVSAEPFLKRQEEELVQKLAARTGKTIELTVDVDESLLGGFRLRMGDVVEDYSIATKLETFKQNIINA
jgi:F-type H+-transporting ATPase subunit delta